MIATFEDVVEEIKKLPVEKDSYSVLIPLGTGAVSVSSDFATRFAGKEVEILSVEAKWSSAPTTSENFTITLSRAGASTPADVVIFSINPSLTSLTSLINIWDKPYVLQPSDEVDIAYTNTDARTIQGRLIVRPRK